MNSVDGHHPLISVQNSDSMSSVDGYRPLISFDNSMGSVDGHRPLIYFCIASLRAQSKPRSWSNWIRPYHFFPRNDHFFPSTTTFCQARPLFAKHDHFFPRTITFSQALIGTCGIPKRYFRSDGPSGPKNYCLSEIFCRPGGSGWACQNNDQ